MLEFGKYLFGIATYIHIHCFFLLANIFLLPRNSFFLKKRILISHRNNQISKSVTAIGWFQDYKFINYIPSLLFFCIFQETYHYRIFYTLKIAYEDPQQLVSMSY